MSLSLKNSGFTLIEMLIVVGMIAALAAIALPAYSKYVERSRRIEGQALINTIAQRQERFFSTYNRYAPALTGAGIDGLGMLGNCAGDIGSENCFYLATLIVPADQATYTIRVEPRPSTPQVDDKCGNLTLTSTGVKGYTGNQENGKCW